MDGIVKEVIDQLSSKYIPRPLSDPVFIPEERYKSLFDMLEVWDSGRNDEDTKFKTQYIFNTLEEQGEPGDLLNGIFNKLGVLPMGENKVDRTYRYLRLVARGKSLFNQYENVKNEAKALEVAERAAKKVGES